MLGTQGPLRVSFGLRRASEGGRLVTRGVALPCSTSGARPSSFRNRSEHLLPHKHSNKRQTPGSEETQQSSLWPWTRGPGQGESPSLLRRVKKEPRPCKPRRRGALVTAPHPGPAPTPRDHSPQLWTTRPQPRRVFISVQSIFTYVDEVLTKCLFLCLPRLLTPPFYPRTSC